MKPRDALLLPLLLAACGGGAGTETTLSDRLTLVRTPAVDSGGAPRLDLVDRETGATCVPVATAVGLRCRPVAPVVAHEGFYTDDCATLAVRAPAEVTLVDIPGAGLHRLEGDRSGCFPVGERDAAGVCFWQRHTFAPEAPLKTAIPLPPEQWPSLDVDLRAEPELAAAIATVARAPRVLR